MRWCADYIISTNFLIKKFGTIHCTFLLTFRVRLSKLKTYVRHFGPKQSIFIFWMLGEKGLLNYHLRVSKLFKRLFHPNTETSVFQLISSEKKFQKCLCLGCGMLVAWDNRKILNSSLQWVWRWVIRKSWQGSVSFFVFWCRGVWVICNISIFIDLVLLVCFEICIKLIPFSWCLSVLGTNVYCFKI